MPAQQREKYQLLGVEVDFFVAPEQAGVVDALAANELDLAYLDSLAYVQAKGRFAFGDVSPTSNNLPPRIMLVEAGAACPAGEPWSCTALAEGRRTGGHYATARAVLNGDADAGGVELRVLRRLKREGDIHRTASEWSKPAGHGLLPWVTRSRIGAAAPEAITTAFQSIDNSRLLDLLHAQCYARVTAGAYEPIRTQATRLSLVAAPR
jgi:phosphonate transport system substrate-binding protein